MAVFVAAMRGEPPAHEHLLNCIRNNVHNDSALGLSGILLLFLMILDPTMHAAIVKNKSKDN